MDVEYIAKAFLLKNIGKQLRIANLIELAKLNVQKYNGSARDREYLIRAISRIEKEMEQE